MLYQAKAEIKKEYDDELSEILFAYGAESVSSEIIDDVSIITAVFSEIENALTFLENNNFKIKPLEDSDWKYKWMETYTGGEITDNIYIVPSDNKDPLPMDYKHIIKLDPRDAFGDGKHPTTKQCSVFLEKYLINNSDASNIKLLDAGTGTGILAIIASLYNVGDIDAVDIEDESVERTKTNMVLNNISGINTFIADIADFKVSKKYDLICANLLTAIVTKNIKSLYNLGAENCLYIISGIGSQWKDEMIVLFTENNFEITESSEIDDWCCFVLKKSK